MNVHTAKTSELIAFYNANSGRDPIKKFTDRKTAEARVQALVDYIAMTTPAPAAEPTESVKPKRERKPAKAAKVKAEKVVKSRRRDKVYAILVEDCVTVAYLAKQLKTVERNIQGDLFFLRKEGYNIIRVSIDGETRYQLGESK
jgi:hypothetical protein